MVPDAELQRPLPEPDDIRVELVLRGAQSLYQRKAPDIAEVYSNPRVCQEATGQLYHGMKLKLVKFAINKSTRKAVKAYFSKKGIEKLGPSVICLSDFEELYGHSKSVKLRINN